MGRPYQVVISRNTDFFLGVKEVVDLAELNLPWAIEVLNKNLKPFGPNHIFIPSQESLPRHDKRLIELAKNIERFDIVDLEVKYWPPKYAVTLSDSGRGEKVIEPCTVPWKTVYYPEEYSQCDLSDEERLWQKIRSIAP